MLERMDTYAEKMWKDVKSNDHLSKKQPIVQLPKSWLVDEYALMNPNKPWPFRVMWYIKTQQINKSIFKSNKQETDSQRLDKWW